MIASFLALIVGASAAWIVLLLPSRRRSLAARLIEPYVTERSSHEGPVVEARRTSRAPARLTAAALRAFRLDQPLHAELRKAGSPRTPEQLAWMTLAPPLGVALLLRAAGTGGGAAVPLVVLSALAPHCVLRFRSARRIRAFDEQLPDILDLLVGSLSVGHSFDQSMRTVAEGAAEPAASEFQQALSEIRLGRPVSEALGEVADRLRSRDLPFVLTAVEIQQQVGGSLAGLLKVVAESVRERQQFRRKVKALTSMGRASALTLIAMPLVAGLGLSLAQPAYMSPLWHSTAGQECVVAALVLMGVGSFVLKRIVAVGS